MRAPNIIALLLVAVLIVGCVSSRRVIDLTVKQSSTCEVHHVAMTTKRVGMTFGMKRDRWSLSLWEARSASFPHADEIYDTHACMGSYEKYARIYVCTACTAARAEWLAAHPFTP